MKSEEALKKAPKPVKETLIIMDKETEKIYTFGLQIFSDRIIFIVNANKGDWDEEAALDRMEAFEKTLTEKKIPHESLMRNMPTEDKIDAIIFPLLNEHK